MIQNIALIAISVLFMALAKQLSIMQFEMKTVLSVGFMGIVTLWLGSYLMYADIVFAKGLKSKDDLDEKKQKKVPLKRIRKAIKKVDLW